MHIEQINIYPVRLPFTAEFSHSLKKSLSAGNVIVEVIAENGHIRGYGEAAPREYVTGESQQSVIASAARFVVQREFPWDIDHVSVLAQYTDALLEGSNHYSAVCALEGAMLDALGQTEGRPVGSYFPSDYATEVIHYGAAIPLADHTRTVEICQIIKNMLGINKIKLKLSTSLDDNQCALEAVRSIYGDDLDLKVDVNCAWTNELAMAHTDMIAAYRIRAVEQPMMPRQPEIAQFAAMLHRMDVALMADESACSLADVRHLHAEGYYNMINVRLSKCGGIRGALRIIDYLRENGIAFQIGCHLGESGILSAAGRALNLLCRDAVYYDGSYDVYLIKENVTTEHVTFGSGGKAGPLPGAGWGVTVSRKNLEKLAGNHPPLSVKRP